MSKTEAFVKNFYGKNVDFIRTLESYQDKNILLRDEDTSQLYVFKRITCDTEHAEGKFIFRWMYVIRFYSDRHYNLPTWTWLYTVLLQIL